jgi:hypothetical protein
MKQSFSAGKRESYVGSIIGDCFHEASHDAGVDVEQIVSRHARLAGHACGDDNEVHILQCCG